MQTIHPSLAAAIDTAGFTALLDEDRPAIQCKSDPWETFAAPDWESLARYAMNYQLCDCPSH